MKIEGSLTAHNQRRLLLISLYTIIGIFIYFYIFDILLLMVLGLASWYGFDFIRDFTKENVEPAGKYVFITGCDSGFGLESAKSIQHLGFGVIGGCYDNESDGAKELKAKKIDVIKIDVTSEESVLECAKELKEICAKKGLWAVINNAGINSSGAAELVSMEMYHKCLEVNLFGPIRVTKSLLPLIRQAQGRIINVTSERGFNPWINNSSYCVSKFGLEAFSACLRREMASFNVKVITVVPGAFAAATALITKDKIEEMQNDLVKSHANLSSQDKEQYYKKEDITTALDERVKTVLKRSCQTAEPVVDAYVDAVRNVDPQRCYMVNGTTRKWLDPLIVMARCRPFIPEKVVHIVEKFVFTILG